MSVDMHTGPSELTKDSGNKAKGKVWGEGGEKPGGGV